MKTNIKMRVTPEQSKKVQEICFENGIEWLNVGRRYIGNIIILYIGKDLMFSGVEFPESFQEIDADLFIRTDGTCEETQKPSYRKTKILNQKKELHKLNLKLQKCIGLEEHHLKIKTVLNEKHKLELENIEMGKLVNLNKSALDLAVMTKDLAIKTVEEQNKKNEQLKAENKSLKESSKISCNMLHSQKDKIDRLEFNYVIEQSSHKKEIENLKAVIEYLESKVK